MESSIEMMAFKFLNSNQIAMPHPRHRSNAEGLESDLAIFFASIAAQHPSQPALPEREHLHDSAAFLIRANVQNQSGFHLRAGGHRQSQS